MSKDKPDLSNAPRINPREFAEMLGMPYISLQRLMKDHHERDPLVKQSIHEHISFTKI